MPNNNMVTLRNKSTGQVVTVPRDKYSSGSDSTGVTGIVNDLSSSLQSLYPALTDMVTSIPGGAKNAASYASSNNPVSTLANLGAGGVEGLAGLASSPQLLLRYLSQKFPGANKVLKQGDAETDPTLYEALKNFEKNNGLAPQSAQEGSVRNIGNLLFGAKGLSSIPNAAGRVAALSAEQAGQGGDPVHAAILGLIGEKTAQMTAKGINKAASLDSPQAVNASPEMPPSVTANMAPMTANPNGYTTISNIPKAAYNVAKLLPQATANAVKNIPEIAGTAASTGLDALAGLGNSARIPVIPSLTEALSDYIKYKSIPPETNAKRKLFSDIESDDLPEINDRMDAAKRLKLSFYTPAEATQSPFEGAKQGTIGRTPAGGKLLLKEGKKRFTSEEEAINTLKNNIYDPEQLDPEKKAAYEKAMSATVPDNFIEKWKQDPIVDHAISQLDSKPTYKRAVQGIPKNSFEYWNIVKRVVGDMEKEEAVGMKKFSSDSATKARNEMVSEMDKIQPEYRTARKIAEREFTRADIDKFFDKRNLTGNEFSKFLQSKSDFKELLDKLEPYPEATQNLLDMKKVFGDLIPNYTSIRTAAQQEKTGMSSARNKVDALKRTLDNKYGQAHDVAAVKLMTNPNWPAMLAEYLKNKGK